MLKRLINVGCSYFRSMSLEAFGEVIFEALDLEEEHVVVDHNFGNILKLDYVPLDDEGDPLRFFGLVETSIGVIARSYLKTLNKESASYHYESVQHYTNLPTADNVLYGVVLEGSVNLAVGKDYMHTHIYEVSPEERELLIKWARAKIDEQNRLVSCQRQRNELLKEYGLDEESIDAKRKDLFKEYDLL